MPTIEALDAQPIGGISLAFILIFFAPLALVVAGFFVYSLFARRSVIRTAKVLSLLWLLACVPAAFLILMGYAFNSSGLNPLVVIPLWVAVGLVGLWLPVALRVVFRIDPV